MMTRTPLFPLLAAVALAACPATATPAAIGALRVADVQVTVDDAAARSAPGLADAIRAAALAEAGRYEASWQPVVLRVRIEKVGFKSGGKALAGSLPMVGMFAGANRNLLKGHVEVADPATGRALRAFDVACDDCAADVGGKAALSIGRVGLSLLPFGALVDSAIEVGEGAANRRDRAQAGLVRGFVAASYRRLYGEAAYASPAADRAAAVAPARS